MFLKMPVRKKSAVSQAPESFATIMVGQPQEFQAAFAGAKEKFAKSAQSYFEKIEYMLQQVTQEKKKLTDREKFKLREAKDGLILNMYLAGILPDAPEAIGTTVTEFERVIKGVKSMTDNAPQVLKTTMSMAGDKKIDIAIPNKKSWRPDWWPFN